MTRESDQVILKRNSIKDATHSDKEGVFKFLLLKHTRHMWCGSGWGVTACDFLDLIPIQKSETKLQTIKVKGFEDLIDGKTALQAVLDGKTVQLTLEPWEEKYWKDFDPLKDEASTKVFFTDLSDGQKLFFRIKPKTVSINGIEVPAPFEPNNGDRYWYITSDIECGYTSAVWGNTVKNKFHLIYGVFRTKEEIKKVIAALRKVFEVQL